MIKNNKNAFTVAFLVFLTAITVSWLISILENKRYHESLYTETFEQLSKIRVQLETAINANFYLTRGMIAYVALNPEIDQSTFRHIASVLLRHKNNIRHIVLAPDNVISFVYPPQGNERALGLDFQKNKNQWPAVEKIMETGRSIVAGPVQLVQGGIAFIFRSPIYILAIDRTHGDDVYWGFASVVIDKVSLFQEAGFYAKNNRLRVAIRGVDGTGEQGAYFDGDKDVFQEDPVLLSVYIPEGSWQLGAVPRAGWAAPSPYILQIQICGLLLSMAVGFLTFFWVRRREQLQRTIQIALTKAQKATLAKSEFLANMSHEIRTPMNSIIGRTHLALEGELDQETRSHLEMISHSSNILLALINDILDLSKIEADELKMENSPFDFHETLKSCIDTAKILLERADGDVVLTYTLAPDVPQLVSGDALRLRQILLNLISNAIKFTKQGRIDLFVDSLTTDDNSLCIQFKLRDSGVGIPPEKLEYIFDQFTQADGSSTRKYGGTGLGLSISQKLCRLMGGIIEVVSIPGKGSTFTFTVSLQACRNEDLPDKQQPSSAMHQPLATSLSLLLVEDNEANRILARIILEKENHLVTEVSDGLQALNLLADHQFDVVVMDVQMPVMDGYTASTIIRAAEQGDQIEGVEEDLACRLKSRLHGGHVPIIAITANAMSGDQNKCLAAGMDYYLAKPFDPDQLNVVFSKISEREHNLISWSGNET